MLLRFRRLFNWLSRDADTASDDANVNEPSSVGALNCPLPEASWHGDHWQNLLSAPLMGARHYVTEDWSLPQAADA